MRTFHIVAPSEAVRRMDEALAQHGRPTGTETINALAAVGRVIARDVLAPVQMPEFRRSTVDGYAVRAADTPGDLALAGEGRMGELAADVLAAGQALRVHTGGHVPEGADAVLMLEDAQAANGSVRAGARLAPGDNIIRAGEDVAAGEVVIHAGTRLREQEIGGLAALGIVEIAVFRQPKVAIIASGDEVVSPDQAPAPGQVRDINSYTIAALVRRHGGVPVSFGILPDAPAAFEEAAHAALEACDCVVFMAGSSVSERDFTPEVIAGLGAPGILAHGIAFRPGKPTLFAVCGGKPVFGLPGNPVSALVTAMLFVAPVLWRLQGALAAPGVVWKGAIMRDAAASPAALEHWIPVSLTGGQAIPIVSKSNLIFGLARADGMICAPIGSPGFAAGEAVDVRLFD